MADYAQRSDANGRFWREDQRWEKPGGYTLTVPPCTTATLTDGATVFFGGDGVVDSTASGRRIHVPKSGILRAAYITAVAGTAGTNESWSLWVRHQVGAPTDTLIEALSSSGAVRVWDNTALSISVSQGDTLAIMSTNPTWATNPADVTFNGVLFIE